MASNLDCVGLTVLDQPSFERLVRQMLDSAAPLGVRDGQTVSRWEDPSGACCTLTTSDDGLIGFLPGFVGTAGALLSSVTSLSDDVVAADVVESDGTLATKMAFELAEHLWVGVATEPQQAAIAALGVDVQVFADDEAFTASPASLLDPEKDDPGPAPADYVERGWTWPPRMATESFVPYGLFSVDADPGAHARLNGTVLRAERRTTQATGQSFVVARVRTVGFEADVCLPNQPSVPEPGNVVAGTVFLTVSIPDLIPAADRPKRSRWPWRR